MAERLKRHEDFPSEYVAARHIDIWLPPGYGRSAERYPIVYMHDGQNLFSEDTAFIGVDWGIDAAMTRCIDEGTVPAALIVGIWNTPERVREYMPQTPLKYPGGEEILSQFVEEQDGSPCSDNYLRFIVQELKPFVDMTYHTSPHREHTFIMGSSMGALVSLYALCEYPDVFAGAGCLSTHWPALEAVITEYLRMSLPDPGAHRIYFDYGTETLDAPYEPWQNIVDEVMRSAGYEEGVDWVTLKFQGAEHSERAWRERVHLPLAFLLGRGSVCG